LVLISILTGAAGQSGIPFAGEPVVVAALCSVKLFGGEAVDADHARGYSPGDSTAPRREQRRRLPRRWPLLVKARIGRRRSFKRVDHLGEASNPLRGNSYTSVGSFRPVAARTGPRRGERPRQRCSRSAIARARGNNLSAEGVGSLEVRMPFAVMVHP